MTDKAERITNLILMWGFIFLMFYISRNPDSFGKWCGTFIHYNDEVQVKLEQIMKR